RQVPVAAGDRSDDERVRGRSDVGRHRHRRVRIDDRPRVADARRRVIVAACCERDGERARALRDGERGALVEREPVAARSEAKSRRQARRLAVLGDLNPEAEADVSEPQHAPEVADSLLGRRLEVVQVVGCDPEPVDEDRSLFVGHGLRPHSVVYWSSADAIAYEPGVEMVRSSEKSALPDAGGANVTGGWRTSASAVPAWVGTPATVPEAPAPVAATITAASGSFGRSSPTTRTAPV